MNLQFERWLKLFLLMTWAQLMNSAPLPDVYTEQTPQIDLNFDQRPSMIFYSPDQNSVAYVPVSNGSYFKFRSALMQSQQKTVNLYNRIFSMAFDTKGQRLYVSVVRNESEYLVTLYYFTISNGKIDDSNNTLCNISMSLGALSCFSKMTVSKWDRIALSTGNGGNGQLVVIQLSDTKTTGIIDSSTNYSSSVNDLQWHPTERQTVILGTNNYNNLIKYNCTSKQSYNLTNYNVYGVGVMLDDGSIIVQSTSTDIYIYTYNGSNNLGLINQINGYTMNSQSVSLNKKIFVASSNMSDILIYELVQTQQIKNGENLQILDKELNIKARPEFKLIFNQSSAAQLKYAGMSADGNQVYFYKGTAKTFTRFSRCGDGKYQSNGQCYNCSSTCKTCHISATQCTSCPPTGLYSFDACVSCKVKYPGCQSCSQTDCQRCNVTANFNSTPYNNKCYCSDSAFPVNEGKQCKFCNDAIVGCSICQNSINCTECNQDGHFELNPVSNLCYCVKPYYLKDNKFCASCDTDIKNCNSCGMVQGVLLCQSCGQGFSLSADKKSCIDCYQISPGCINCGDNITCLQCDTVNNFVKIGSKCQCITNYAPSQTKCVPCTSLFGCSTCSDIYTCTKCIDGTGLNLQNGECKCNSGSAFDGRSCIPCSQITGCLSCSNGQNCTQCDQANGFDLSANGQCVCRAKFYLNKNICESCSAKFPYCSACSYNGSECLTCEFSQQKLNQNKTACVCDDYKYLDQNKNCQLCDPNQKCISCQNNYSCTKCDTQKYFNSTPVGGQCQCQSGYVEQNNACVICNVKGCSQCPSFNNCSKCMTEKKFSVDPVNNLCVCKAYTYLNDQKTQCFTCGQKMYGCTNCTSLSLCTSCDSSKNFKVNSAQSGCTCMDNYFLRDNDCLKCTAFVQYCASCYQQRSDVNCDRCNAGFVYNQTANKCVCPDGFEINSSQECRKKQDGGDGSTGQGVELWQVLAGLVLVIVINGVISYVLIKKCKKTTPPSPSYQQPQTDYFNNNNNYNHNYNKLINATQYPQQQQHINNQQR